MGDEIEFCENENPSKSIVVRVTGLLKHPSFEELFADREPTLFGQESKGELLQEVRSFYSIDEEQRYGVVGIRFEVV